MCKPSNLSVVGIQAGRLIRLLALVSSDPKHPRTFSESFFSELVPAWKTARDCSTERGHRHLQSYSSRFSQGNNLKASELSG